MYRAKKPHNISEATPGLVVTEKELLLPKVSKAPGKEGRVQGSGQLTDAGGFVPLQKHRQPFGACETFSLLPHASPEPVVGRTWYSQQALLAARGKVCELPALLLPGDNLGMMEEPGSSS